MLTGIMAMFEMATSFDSQQFQLRPPPDTYSGSDAQRADRDLLRLFSHKNLRTSMVENDKPWFGDSLCDQLMCKFNQNASDRCSPSNTYNSELFGDSPLQKKNYVPGVRSLSNAENLKGACALSSGSHRVLVVPNPDFDLQDQASHPYRLFTCLTALNQQECMFETQN